MGILGDLVVRIVGDDKQFKNAITNSERKLKSFDDKAKALAKNLSNVGMKLSTFVTLPILGIGAAFVKAAADAEEVNSKFDTVFRDQADSVRIWAQEFSNATGRSTIENVKFLASVQDLFVPLGVARGEASGLAKSVVTLATDMASFNNLPTADVIRDIQSALVGNHESVRKYGVVLDEATINQELLNIGIAGGSKKATAAEKALARLNLIMAGTTDAQGDAIRTADSFTNRFVALQSSIKDLAESFGSLLLPIIKKIVESIAGAVRFFNGLNESQKELLLTIAALAASIGPTIFLISKMISAFLALKVAIIATSSAMAITPWGLIAIAVGLLAGGLIALVAATKSQEEGQIELNKSYDEGNKLLEKNIELNVDAAVSRDLFAKSQQIAAKQRIIDAKKEELEGERSILKRKKLRDEIARLEAELKIYQKTLFDSVETTKDSTKTTEDQTGAIEDQTGAIEETAASISRINEIRTHYDNLEKARLQAIEDFKQELQEKEEENQKENTEKEIEINDTTIARMYEARKKYWDNRILWINTIYDRKKEKLADEAKAEEAAADKTEKMHQQLYDARLSMITSVTTSMGTIWDNYYGGLLKNEALTDTQRKKILRERAVASKSMGLFQVAINTASAIIKMLADPSGYAGVALSIMAGITGAAQAAAIASKPLPALAEGGIIHEPTVLLAGERGPEKITPLGEEQPIIVGISIDGRALDATITRNVGNRRILIAKEAVI